MSTIRISGVLFATGVLVFAFFYFRGKRWNRGTFLSCAIFGNALLLVSLIPESVNLIRDALRLGDFEYGRLLTLLIFSNGATLLLVLYGRAKHDALKDLVDRGLRGAAIDAVMAQSKIGDRLKRIMVIIPALNEADNLRVLLPKIPKQVHGIDLGVLVVDDGSTDETGRVALEHGCLVARTPINRGQGAASRVGYGLLERNHVAVGVTMDADDQHDPGEIVTLVEPILAGHLDLVIGSRVLGSAQRGSRTRSMGVSFFSLILGLLIGVKITDCSSGFKAFKIDQMAKLDLREDQFQSSEVLISAAKKGLRIGEVPIHVRQRGFGQSRKGTNLKYGIFWLRAMAKSWWH